MMNPFIVDEERAPAGSCIIRKYLNAINSCDEICNACIFFIFVNEFNKNEFNFL